MPQVSSMINLQHKETEVPCFPFQKGCIQMKRSKILLLSVAVLLVCGAFAIPALAEATYQSPAQAAAGVTGMSLEEVQQERAETGKTYGEIAAENDRLDEFREAKLSMQEESVSSSSSTVSSIGNGNGVCDGSCNGTGVCDGTCTGAGYGNGNGVCDGSCNGTGICDGSCISAGNGNNNGVCDGSGTGNGNGMCDGTGSGNATSGSGHHGSAGHGKNQ